MEITPYATKHTGAFLSFLELYHKNPFWMPVSVHGTGGKKGHRMGTEPGQDIELATACPKTSNSMQAHPLLGDGVPDFTCSCCLLPCTFRFSLQHFLNQQKVFTSPSLQVNLVNAPPDSLD